MRGFSLNELESAGFSKSTLNKEIKAGRLVARKRGKSTTVLPEDWEAYLKALPILGRDVPIVEPEMLRGTQRKRDDAAA